MSRSIGVVAICVAIVLLVLTVFNVYESHKHVFRMAFPAGPEADIFRDLGHTFCKQRGISCRFVVLDYYELYRRELLELKGLNGGDNDADDVIAVDDPWLPRFKATGKLVKLGRSDIKADPADFIGQTLRIACIDLSCDGILAVPILGNAQLLGVNLDLRKKTQGQPICDPNTKAGPCEWKNIINGDGIVKSKTNIVLRGGSRNPFLTDFAPLLKREDPNSLPDYLSIQRPAFTPKAIGAFVKFMAMARQAPESYGSMADFDGLALMFNNVAGYGVTWSNTSMRSVLDLRDIPGAGEVAGVSHVQHIKYRMLPGNAAELGVWLLALPDTRDPYRIGVARDFLAWVTATPTKGAKPKDNPLLGAAINDGNPPTMKAIYANDSFQKNFPDLYGPIKDALEARVSCDQRNENWDCMRQEISEQLKGLSLQATASPQEPPGPHRDAEDREHAATTAKQLNLFVGCIQLEQENITRQEEKRNHPATDWACDPYETEEVQGAVQICRDDLKPTEDTLRLRLKNDADSYQNWKDWIQVPSRKIER